jgi:hypothetical protein
MRTRTIWKMKCQFRIASRMGSITSVGFPIIPASPPAIPAQAMVEPADSLPLFLRCKLRARISYNANRAVEYVVWRNIEADKPDQRDRIPAKSGGESRAGVQLTVTYCKSMQCF